MEPNDGELWRRARAGDGDAFGLLFERHADAIYNFCFRRVGDWAISEDLLSVVFLEAWRVRDRDLPSEKVLPWLYGIAANVVRNQRRSRRRFKAALARIPKRTVDAMSKDAEERLEDERQIGAILAVTRQLPERQQEVFVLCTWFLRPQLRGSIVRVKHPHRDRTVPPVSCTCASPGAHAADRT